MKSLPVQKGKIVGFPDNCNKKPPSFRSNKHISDQLLHTLLKNNRNYGLEKIIPFPIEKIDVAEWVRLKCQFGCSQYNTNWCCPAGIFTGAAFNRQPAMQRFLSE